MSGATAEALAWRERADELLTKGVAIGMREICPDCLRPLWQDWLAIPRCRCGREQTVPSLRLLHGLAGLPNERLAGTTTYG